VTGGGSGIGRALALALAARGLYVLVVGRRREALRQTCELASQAKVVGAVEDLAADVSSAQGRQAVAERVTNLCGTGDRHLACVVHNAAVLGEVGQLEQLTPKCFQEALTINVEGPLFLTQALLPFLAASPEGGRVLHISSGAAHGPLEGWLTYCTSKAALLQTMRCLDQELAPRGVRVGSVMPGVVDTPMQQDIRSKDFPAVDYFRSLNPGSSRSWDKPTAPPQQLLDSPDNVAAFLAWLLLEVKAVEFGGREWDINDPESQQRWLTACK